MRTGTKGRLNPFGKSPSVLGIARQTQVQPFKNSVSNSATQVSIMNIHKKIQITYAQINCVLKDSSCDTPLLEILVPAILATCASSSSTKNHQSDATLTLKKRNIMHVFTHRFALIFQSTFDSAYSRSK
ncbi:hypothetical protein H5410_050833, partial [Solanum commersonii]